MGPKSPIYTMPSGVPFLPSLAKGLRAIYGERLQDALILLPTRRAVRELGNAFVTQSESGSGASLLPRMRPLADINPEEPPFEPGELAGLVTPSIDPLQRRFELTRLVLRYYEAVSDVPLDIAGALSLTDPLLAILDDGAMEEIDLSGIAKLDDIQNFAAEHFQNAVKLYEIVQDFWPERLAELGLMDPMARRVALLNALTNIWEQTPPDYPVIVAGSTGTLGASARLMRCVSNMADGLIVLPGLNIAAPNTAWGNVGPQHPQNSLKRLIETLGVSRAEVPAWKHIVNGGASDQDARRRVISEALVPIESTGDWPSRIATLKKGDGTGGDPFQNALKGLSLIEADNDEEEALAIALILREVLETPDKSAALVTPDPALARRVKARMRRWGVEIDYSQGEPLEETALGSFITAILDYAQDPQSGMARAALCKHPLAAMGRASGELAAAWRDFEYKLRRPQKDKVMPGFELQGDLDTLFAALLGFKTAGLADFAQALTRTAEALSASDEQVGAARLWVDDAGEKAMGLLEGLMRHGKILPQLDLAAFAKLMASMMRGRVVRPRFGTHPRLSILGPLEARMLSADKIILGGLNEGIWPAAPSAEPFLSRGMRKALGLSLHERRFGLSAHDFAELSAHPQVVLTRSKRGDEGPSVASRWLWRLQTLMTGALKEVAAEKLNGSNHYLAWARSLDSVGPEQVTAAKRPLPTPDPTQRWPRGRKLSITQIKTWIRDPYSIYARHILALSPLDDLDRALDARDYGNALHKGLENFTKVFPKALPKDAPERLVTAFEAAMAAGGYPDFAIAKERARLSRIADDVIGWMAPRRAVGWAMRGVERRGELKIADLDFTLTGYADMIEKGPAGFAVTDYKTGAPATIKVVKAGFDPQLPLTAFMLSEGAIEKEGAGDTQELNYIRLKGAGESKVEYPLTRGSANAIPAAEYMAKAVETLRQLIESYDKKETGYASQPRAQYTHDYGDYDHLARRDEWMRLGSENESPS